MTPFLYGFENRFRFLSNCICCDLKAGIDFLASNFNPRANLSACNLNPRADFLASNFNRRTDFPGYLRGCLFGYGFERRFRRFCSGTDGRSIFFVSVPIESVAFLTPESIDEPILENALPKLKCPMFIDYANIFMTRRLGVGY